MSGTMMLYEYHRTFIGNVCLDWRLTNDINTKLHTSDGKDAVVNSKAFEQFLNPQYAGKEDGSCQGAGYESKQ